MLRRILIFIVPLFFSCYTWAQVQIEWTAMVGVNYDEATGSLTKTETDGWNNAGARSLNRLDENEDGIIKYVINNLSTEKAIGLSTKNNDQKIKSLDYALVFNGNKLSIYEAGKFKGQFGKIKIGDEVSIEREGNKIIFRKNRKQIKELNTNSTHQLYADIAIFTQGGSISGLTASFNKPLEINFTKQDASCIEGSSGLIDVTTTGGTPPYNYSWSNGATTEDISSLDIGEYTLIVTDANAKTKKQKVNILSEVVWKKLDGVTYVNGVITKVGLTGWSTGEAISYNRLLGNTDGFVEYQIDEINTTKILALTTESNIEGLNGLKYSLFIYNNNLFIFEDGIYKGYFGKIRIGDQLTIKREGTRIEYRNNKKLLKKTTVDQTQELIIKLALYTQGATFNNLKSNFCNVPFFVDFTVTLVTQNALGAITLNPQFGTLPYAYLWNDGSTTKDRDNLESGIYYVTITDALSQIIQLKIVVGMELEFANVTGMEVINNEELIKNLPDGNGNAMTTLNNLVDGDGEVRVEITDPTKEFTFGFRAEQNPQATSYAGLSYGLFVNVESQLFSYDKESGLKKIESVVKGDIISIEKVTILGKGDFIYYKKNDSILAEVYIALAIDTIIIPPRDTSRNDTLATPGRILSINDTTSTTTIISLTDGTESTYTDSLPSLAVEGSTVSYTKDTTTNTVSDVKFPVATALADPRLCDTKKGEVPLFKIDFSLYSTKTAIANIKVIKFSVIPKLTATINHAVCNTPNSGSIESIVKGGVPPYTYNWTNPSGFSASTAEITNINPGIYTLTVTDSWTVPHIVSDNYEVGYALYFANLAGCRNTDTTLDRSVSRSELCAAMASKGTAQSMNQINAYENGGFTYIVDQLGYTKTFGISEKDKGQAADVIDYSIQFKSDGKIIIIEQGADKGSFGIAKIGDVIKIERLGDQIIYKNNEQILRATLVKTDIALEAKFILDETCASFNNLYTDFCNIPYFVIDTRDITDINSYTLRVESIGLNRTYTTGTEEIVTLFFPNNEDLTLSISLNDLVERQATIEVVVNAKMEMVSSTTRIIENGTTYEYKTQAYGDKSGTNLKFNLTNLFNNYIKKCFGDNNINWMASKFFDEDGNLVSSNKSYFNYLGNPTQSQAKSLTDNNIIAAQTIYDAYGRSVLSTLPTPIYEQSFCYKNDIIQATNENTPYDYTKFDVPNYTTHPSVIVNGEVDRPVTVEKSTKGTLGWYYSDNNTEEPYVSTTNFPYSRVEYDPNNPGVIKRASAPHNLLKMGSGHETKSFSMSASGELNYVFGYANGWVVDEDFGPIQGDPYGNWEIHNTNLKTNYQVIKNITIDQDGKESIVFIDNKGNEIAKCYSGTGDDETNQNEYHVLSYIPGGALDVRYVDIHLPVGCQSSLEIENDNGYNVYHFLDLDKNKLVDFGGTNDFTGTQPNLDPGYYRVIHYAGGNVNNILTLSYDLNYYDFTLYYYDKADRMVAIVPPKGIDETYDPNLSITNSYASSYFVESSPAYGLGTVSNPYMYSAVVPPVVGDQKFSSISFYIDRGTTFGGTITDPVGNTSTSRLAPGTTSYGGRVAATELEFDEIQEAPGGNPCPCIINPAVFCTDQVSEDAAALWLNCGVANVNVSTQPNNYAGTTTDQDGNIVNLWWFCVSCDLNSVSPYRKYDIKIDVYADDNPTVKLAEGRWITATFSNGQWHFTSNSEDESIDILLLNIPGVNTCTLGASRSEVATNLIFEVVELHEYSWELIPVSNTFHLVETYYFDKLPELRLNARIATHTFAGSPPAHTMISASQYNSISQVLKNIDVDAGITDYVYSEEGLLRFSRNAKQKAAGKFSYTNYDELGRPIESGEYNQNVASTGAQDVYFQNHYNEYPSAPGLSTTNPTVLNDLDYADLTSAGKTSDKVFSQYDYPDDDFNAITLLSTVDYKQQIYLGNVAKTWTKLIENSSVIPNTTWYSYDEQGRVLWMVQLFDEIGVKTIDYVYNTKGDLEQVIYQKNLATEYFAHLYTYDIDKRLINVKTKDNPIAKWKQQAHYYYYQHGPLKRTELADGLQGIDYLYTTLGQLKAINSPNIGEFSSNQFVDPGKDGVLNNFATDVFGMSIDYFSGDYTRSGTFVNYGITQGEKYNGNIKDVRWNTQGLDAPATGNQWMYAYEYNKKGWLKQATFGEYSHDACQDVSLLCPIAPGQNNLNLFVANTNSNYKVSNLNYDPNGNILSLNRNAFGTNVAMDELNYLYYFNTNKLMIVNDQVVNSNWTVDIDSDFPNSQQSTIDYEYDEIGQLTNNIKDRQYFVYNVSGLVTDVYTDNTQSQLIAKYFYDDKGFRYKKAVYDYNGTGALTTNTYYVRDVAGTIQHIYTEDVINATNTSEYPLYASSRIGNYFKGGDYVYELSDYLGNVRTTIKDLGTTMINVHNSNFDMGLEGWSSPSPGVNVTNPNNNLVIAMSTLGMGVNGNTANSQPITIDEGFNYDLSFIYNLVGGNVTAEIWSNGTLIKSELIVPTTGIKNISFYIPGNSSTTVDLIFRSFNNIQLFVDDINIDKKEHQLDVLSYADYYPFGEKLPGRTFTSSLLYKYGYQGQFAEKDEETGLDAFELRLWDGRIGCWQSPDPFGQYHSPYLGMGNNPIIGIDPRGGICETCPTDDYWNEYISSSDYWTFDDGITYLTDVGFEINGNNWYDPLLNWDSDFHRMNTGDALSFSFDGIFAMQMGPSTFGGSFKYETIFILHGEDKFSFKNIITLGDKIEGQDVSLAFNLNRYNYLGKIINFQSTDFYGLGESWDLGVSDFDIGYSRTAKDGSGNSIHGISLGASFGSPFGLTRQRATETIPWNSLSGSQVY